MEANRLAEIQEYFGPASVGYSSALVNELLDEIERLNRAYEVLAKSFEAISPSAYKAAMERIGKDGEQG